MKMDDTVDSEFRRTFTKDQEDKFLKSLYNNGIRFSQEIYEQQEKKLREVMARKMNAKANKYNRERMALNQQIFKRLERFHKDHNLNLMTTYLNQQMIQGTITKTNILQKEKEMLKLKVSHIADDEHKVELLTRQLDSLNLQNKEGSSAILLDDQQL